MAIPFTLISVGAVMIFLGLLNGDITVWHDIVKFGGCALVAVGLVSSAVVASRRKQAERVARLQEGLPQAAPLVEPGGGHH